jgi:hypothetical protein
MDSARDRPERNESKDDDFLRQDVGIEKKTVEFLKAFVSEPVGRHGIVKRLPTPNVQPVVGLTVVVW